jgi:hypothetical protein
MQSPLFETEEDAIYWVYKNMALAIKQKNNPPNAPLIFIFTSDYAYLQVVEHLGQQLFKHQQEKYKKFEND